MGLEEEFWSQSDNSRQLNFQTVPLLAITVLSVLLVFIQRKQIKGLDFKRFSLEDDTSINVTTATSKHHEWLIEIPRSTPDRLRVALETVLVLMMTALTIVEAFCQNKSGSILARCIFWMYCSLLVCLRFYFGGNQTLWYHSTTIYPLAWLLAIVKLGDAMTHKESTFQLYFEVTVLTILFYLNWSSKSGDSAITAFHSPGTEISAESKTSLFGLVSFSYMNHLLWNGYWNPVNYSQIYDLHMGDHAREILDRYYAVPSGDGPSDSSFLAKALRLLKCKLLLCCAYATVHAFTVFTPAILIKLILDYVDNPSGSSPHTAWTCVGGMFFFSVLSNSINGQALYLGRRMSVHMRAIIVSEIYSKALKRKVVAFKGQSTTGSVINLMSVDAFKLSELFSKLHFVLGSLIQIFTAIFLMYFVLGWSAFVGAAATMLVVPVNYAFMSAYVRFQNNLMKLTDQRIEKTNELLQCMKIIKYFAWEDKFADKVREVRMQELAALKRRLMLWVFGVSIWLFTPVTITCSTFASYSLLQGKTLTSPIAFTALSLFTLLRLPIEQMSESVSEIMDAKVSLNRLNKYFNEEENSGISGHFSGEADVGYIGFKDASFRWLRSSSESGASFSLRDLNIEFPQGKMTVVTGGTGSGKSSLLMALLGEMDLVEGRVCLGSSVNRAAGNAAYCAQQPWLLNDTIRNNILFATEYESQRYNQVIRICALSRDLEILGGDETMVGDKGIVLSGGQKQRISLARAIYSRSDTLLLDDCLSAVDSDTALYIYKNCLAGSDLVAGRTIILVSHNIALTTSQADKVVILENGYVKAQGTPVDVIDKFDMQNSTDNKSKSKISSEDDATEQPAYINESRAEINDSGSKLVKEETMSSGYLDKEVFLSYFRFNGGTGFWVGLALAFCLENFFKMWLNVWIRNWSLGIGGKSVEYYIGCYLLIGLFAALTTCSEVAYLMMATLRASRAIFDSLLESVIRANSRFFDSTPIGRIMNRFSKDIEGIDQEVPIALEGVFHFTFTALLTLCLIIFITPPFLFVGIAIILVYVSVAGFFLTTSRELNRMDSVTRSPVFEHFGQTLMGVSTIRAYGQCERFTTEIFEKLDYNHRPFMYMWCANRWLYFRVELMGSLVALGSGAFVLLNINKIDSGLAGLSLSYALSFNEVVLWSVRMYAEFEMAMNGVERATEYMNIPSEPQDGDETPLNWPSQGSIEFKNLSLRYAPELPRVIDDISFKVPERSKIAIIGRTGAGKSTILSALYRFLEADSGNIYIDGIDISTLRLQSLRRSLAIILQDPTLFIGTLRTNLDPFGEYTDSRMFEALRRVHLIGPSASSSGTATPASNSSENFNQFENLDSPITEYGQNLSQGQRQLVCLARSLLKNPKIMLLDEATASIDHKTDAKIQQTIREELKDCTLLTIAHRIKTVIDYDMILVLDQGRVVQFDTPRALLHEVDGLFRDLCEKSGQLNELLAALS